MFKGLKNFLERVRKSDRADSMVSVILTFPLLFMMLITMIDYSIYMINRGQVQMAVRDAANTVAIFGGNGNGYMATPIENAYNVSRDMACNGLQGERGLLKNAINRHSTTVECLLADNLNRSSGLTNIEVYSVQCYPEVTTYIGQRVTCQIGWKNGGVPGSALSFIGTGDLKYTKGTAESEVRFDVSDMVPRR